MTTRTPPDSSLEAPVLLRAGTHAQWVAALNAVENPNLVIAGNNPFAALSFAKNMVGQFKNVIEQVIEGTRVGIADIVAALKTKSVFKMLKALGFNLAKLFKATQKLAAFGPTRLVLLFEAMEKSGKLDALKSGAMKIDDFLKEHPLLAKAGGILVAALLLWVWTSTMFTGHLTTDLDLTPIFAALVGSFSLTELFTSPQGLAAISMLVLNLASAGTPIAMVTGLISYSGATLANLFVAVLFTGLHEARRTKPAQDIAKWIRTKVPVSASASRMSARARLTANRGQTIPGVLETIKTRIHMSDKEMASRGWDLDLCHNKTARAIRDRKNPTDIVWLYGDGASVTHSVLTDATTKVIVGGSFGGSSTHRFMGDLGFKISNEIGIYELMKRIKAKELLL